MPPSLAWTIGGRSDTGWDLTVVRDDPGVRSAARPDLAALSEPDLIAACLAGRAEAFDLVVERHRRAVYNLCYRFVGNHEDASDLTQDTFLRAFRGLKNFKGNAALATWLHRIGVNVCLNRVSIKKLPLEPIGPRGPRDDDRFIDHRTESPSDHLLRDERATQVRAAIEQLPKKQKAALVLRMYQEMSHQEIAESLGSSVGAVKANVFHALQNLKKLLGEGAR